VEDERNGAESESGSGSGSSSADTTLSRRKQDISLVEMRAMVRDLKVQLKAAEEKIEESNAKRAEADKRTVAVYEEKKVLHSRLWRATHKAHAASPGQKDPSGVKSPHRQHEIQAKVELRRAQEKLAEQAEELLQLRQAMAALRASPALSASGGVEDLRRQRDELASELASERESSLERLQRHQRMKVEALAALQATHASELEALRKEHKHELEKRRIMYERSLRAAFLKSDGTVPPHVERKTHTTPDALAKDLASSTEKVRNDSMEFQVQNSPLGPILRGSAHHRHPERTPSTARGSPPPRMGPLDEYLASQSHSEAAALDSGAAHNVSVADSATTVLDHRFASEGASYDSPSSRRLTPMEAREARKKELTSHLALLKKKRPGMV